VRYPRGVADCGLPHPDREPAGEHRAGQAFIGTDELDQRVGAAEAHVSPIVSLDISLCRAHSSLHS
jgi:hypothetical protein